MFSSKKSLSIICNLIITYFHLFALHWADIILSCNSYSIKSFSQIKIINIKGKCILGMLFRCLSALKHFISSLLFLCKLWYFSKLHYALIEIVPYSLSGKATGYPPVFVWLYGFSIWHSSLIILIP